MYKNVFFLKKSPFKKKMKCPCIQIVYFLQSRVVRSLSFRSIFTHLVHSEAWIFHFSKCFKIDKNYNNTIYQNEYPLSHVKFWDLFLQEYQSSSWILFLVIKKLFCLWWVISHRPWPLGRQQHEDSPHLYWRGGLGGRETIQLVPFHLGCSKQEPDFKIL